MPCRCDDFDPPMYHLTASRLFMLVDEVKGKGPPDPDKYLSEIDNRVYKSDYKELDKMTAFLCKKLNDTPKKTISNYSLELQLWWRNHQIVDARRKKVEEERARINELKQKALSKLTDEEKKALRLS